MHAMPLLIAILCLMAIAYRYYSAFLAAKVAALSDSNATPAVRLNDGQNYHPTNKWVLFGHHFAAISGAGPLIGPVLAAQFGYLPGLLWIVIGVCLAGAVQDFLVLSASIRRGGRSLAQIAYSDVGKTAGTAATVAILFIIVIALAGLGKVVVKALGGEEVKYPAGSQLVLPVGVTALEAVPGLPGVYLVPAGTRLLYNNGAGSMDFQDTFKMRFGEAPIVSNGIISLPKDARNPQLSATPRLVPGSSWGTFTISCTIPIALLVGLYMYKIRPGHVVEASIIGALLTIGATFLGGKVPGSPIEHWFDLRDKTVVYAMAAYGFIASVLPVWVLLCPRDYLSSFLKIGTIALLVGGTIIANPKLEARAINPVFAGGGPVVGSGSPKVMATLFPFLFITIMCGAISGFHALVSSGTTPKMIGKESDARTIGYGAMLIEGLVGVVAMIAAAALPVGNYYGMNVELGKVPQYQKQLEQMGAHIDSLPAVESQVNETLRGRTGGAVTLAVGMAHIFDDAAKRISARSEHALSGLIKYWYHFAIMFEALFILTTIDTGTRIGRFLLQEVAGKAHPLLGKAGWWPGAIVSTLLVVAGWAYFINANSFAAIWPMFGVANQMLAVIALAIVSVWLVNEGRARYLWVTVTPMLVVATTTGTASARMLAGHLDVLATQWSNPPAALRTTILINSGVQAALILAMLICGAIVVVSSAIKIWSVTNGLQPQRAFQPAIAAE